MGFPPSFARFCDTRTVVFLVSFNLVQYLPSLPLCSASSWSLVSGMNSWTQNCQNCRKSQNLGFPKMSRLKHEFQARYVPVIMVIMLNYIPRFNLGIHLMNTLCIDTWDDVIQGEQKPSQADFSLHRRLGQEGQTVWYTNFKIVYLLAV